PTRRSSDLGTLRARRTRPPSRRSVQSAYTPGTGCKTSSIRCEDAFCIITCLPAVGARTGGSEGIESFRQIERIGIAWLGRRFVHRTIQPIRSVIELCVNFFSFLLGDSFRLLRWLFSSMRRRRARKFSPTRQNKLVLYGAISAGNRQTVS